MRAGAVGAFALRRAGARTIVVGALALGRFAIVAARPLMLGRRGRSAIAERTMMTATAASAAGTAPTAAGAARATTVEVARTFVVARLALLARTLRRSGRHVLVCRCGEHGNTLVG